MPINMPYIFLTILDDINVPEQTERLFPAVKAVSTKISINSVIICNSENNQITE